MSKKFVFKCDTADLIKGVLPNMRETAASWNSEEFATETVELAGATVTHETKSYYVKVGQEAQEVIVGSHEEKIGTKKVKVGSHREKSGTRLVKNPDKKWWSFWRDSYIEVDNYVTVDDYKEEDVYKTVLDYKTVMKDIFEERTKQIEKFSVDVDRIQTALTGKFRMNIDDGISKALEYAKEQINDMKIQFTAMFDELDNIIKQKYDELNRCADEQKHSEEQLRHNREILQWIEGNIKEIDDTLDLKG